MASILDVSKSSDSEDDVDYASKAEVGDSSFDEEDVSDHEDSNTGDFNGKKMNITKRGEGAEIKADSSAKIEEKQRVKDLWESFLNDVESVTPKKNSNSAVCNSSATTEIQNESETKAPTINTKPVCKVFEFAGQTVTINSKYLDSCVYRSQQTAQGNNNSESVPTEKTSYIPKKRGIDSVLGTIMNKNKKLSVLDKTLIDWKMFKEDEGLENDLEKFNKGKQGFIERQRFLERSDLRSFEMEKSMRQRVQKK